MNVIPVIAHIEKQHDKVKRLIEHCRRLDGTELLVIPVSPAIEKLPYPLGAERVREEVMRQMQYTPFLWLEVDSVPFRPGWLKAISDEYFAADKLFLLPSLVGAPGCDFASGIGVYPPNAYRIIPTTFTHQAWDGWIYKHMMHAVHFSRAIQHSYAHVEDGKSTRKHSFPEDNDILRPDAYIFHADPTQSLLGPGVAPAPATGALGPETIMVPDNNRDKVSGFYHSGDFGDIIASLPVIRHLGGGVLYLGPHTHPGRGPREGMNPTRFAVIKPLLDGLPYLTKVEFVAGPPADVKDFSSFRQTPQLPAENLIDWQARHLGVDDIVDASPWLLVPASLNNLVVVARSMRYQTPNFPWKQILRKYGQSVMFVGLPVEHQAFQQRVGRVQFSTTKTLLDVAKLIAGAKFCFCNQSCCFWISAALGKPTVQETCLTELNSIVGRPGLVYTGTQAELNHVYKCVQ